MMRALLWKEYREQRLQIVALSLVAHAVLTLGIPMLDLGMAVDNTLIFSFAMLFAWSSGMVTGAILLANEAETGAQTFLDTQPAWRRQIWRTKVTFGLVATAIEMVVFLGVCYLIRIKGQAEPPLIAYVEVVSAGFLGLACGVLGSALGRSVLAAVGWSIVVIALNAAVNFALYWLLFGLGEFMMSIAYRDNAVGAEYAAGTVVALTTMLIPFMASRWIYTRIDEQRRSSDRFAGFVRRRAARAAWGLKATLWMSLKQGRAVYAVLAASALVVGPLLLAEPMISWPAVTLLLGVLAGVTTFADEQRLASYRFLAEQRLPLGRLWFWKVASRFALAFAVTVALLLAAFAALALLSEIAGPAATRLRLFGSSDPDEAEFFRFQKTGPWMFLVVWLVYGYSFGLLGGMLARKTFLAVVFALPAAVMALAPWVPTFFASGLPGWELLVVPVGVLALARWAVWPWATERLYSPPVLVRWVWALSLALVWTVGCLGYRVWQVPPAGEPFDVAEFRAGYRDLEKSLAPSLIRSAAIERDRHVIKLIETGALPADFTTQSVSDPSSLSQRRAAVPREQPGRSLQPEPVSFDQRAEAVTRVGWRAADAEFAKHLDLIAGGEWLETLEKAAPLPLGVFHLPIADFPVTRIVTFGPLLTARALQLQHQGDHAAALHLLTVQLAVARHGMSRAAVHPYLDARHVETIALRGLSVWTDNPTVPPALLEQALTELQRHEAARPSYVDAAKVEYLMGLDRFSSLPRTSSRARSDESRLRDMLLLTPMIAPWERARRMRLFNGFSRYDLDAAAADFPTLLARSRAAADGRLDPNQEYLQTNLLRFDSEGSPAARDRAVRLLNSDFTVFLSVTNPLIGLTSKAVNLCRLRAAQLRLALLIYEHRHGRPAERLTDLVPDVLAELPADPFTNGPFHYRVSKGEMINWSFALSFLDATDDWVLKEYEIMAGGAPGGAAVPQAAMGAAGPAPPEKWRPALRGETATHRRVRPGEGVLWACGVDGVDNGGMHQSVHESNGQGFNYSDNCGPDMIFVVPKVGTK